MMNITFGAVGAGAGTGATSRYGSGSTKMMRLLAAPAPQHCFYYAFALFMFGRQKSFIFQYYYSKRIIHTV
jgi:hypothetical protein